MFSFKLHIPSFLTQLPLIFFVEIIHIKFLVNPHSRVNNIRVINLIHINKKNELVLFKPFLRYLTFPIMRFRPFSYKLPHREIMALEFWISATTSVFELVKSFWTTLTTTKCDWIFFSKLFYMETMLEQNCNNPIILTKCLNQ